MTDLLEIPDAVLSWLCGNADVGPVEVPQTIEELDTAMRTVVRNVHEVDFDSDESKQWFRNNADRFSYLTEVGWEPRRESGFGYMRQAPHQFYFSEKDAVSAFWYYFITAVCGRAVDCGHNPLILHIREPVEHDTRHGRHWIISRIWLEGSRVKRAAAVEE